jgi:hypothetical protein
MIRAGKAVGAEAHGRAGGVPEVRIIVHVFVIRRADKHVQRHTVRHVGNVPAQHLADRQVAIIDRRAKIDVADTRRAQQKRMARFVGLEHRRIF